MTGPVFEVAESSLDQDLVEKANLYAEHGIAEYWVVAVASEQVYVHRSPREGKYQSIQIFGKASVISPVCQDEAKLALDQLFDLYS